MKADLSSPRNRLLLAAAISIALHEIAAGLVPRDLWRPTPSREVITRAQLLRVAIRPVVTPSPTPIRMVERVRPVLAASQAIAAKAGAFERAPRAASAARRAPPRRIDPGPAWSGRPVWDAEGAGNARAAVASAVTAGSGAAATTGGNAGAPASNDLPCGFVTFSDPHGSQYDPRTHGFWVDIRISVSFADGTTQSTILDYPWYYPSEATNPWSAQNLRDPNFPTRFQQPPSGKTAGEPPLVQYVMTHSTADGLTLLRDCPSKTGVR